MKHYEIIRQAANELADLIEQKNDVLRLNILCSDLDDPEYHDYQTVSDLLSIARNMEKLELKKGDN